MGKKFFGSYSRNLDPKGRLLLPSKLGIPSNETLYLCRGLEGCLSVYLEKDFMAMDEKLEALNFLDRDTRAYIRLLTSSIVDAEVDSHGRILLSKALLEEYGLSNKLVILGVMDHLEIWDEEKYASYKSGKQASFEDLAGKSI